VAGADLLGNPLEVRKKIGYVPQAIGETMGGTDPSCLVIEELLDQAALYRIGPAQARQRAELSYATGLLVKSEDAFAPLINTVVVPLLLLSGIFLPLTLGPGWLQGIARISPFRYIIDAMREAYLGHYFNTIMVEGIAVAVGMAMLFLWLGSRVFVQEIQGEAGAAQGADDARQRVDPLVGPAGRERDRVAAVGLGLVEDERALGRRVDRVFVDEAAILLFEDQHVRMRIGEIEMPARHQQRCDGLRPAHQVRQPADRAPGHIGDVEIAGDGAAGVINIGADEFGGEPGPCGQQPRLLDRRR